MILQQLTLHDFCLFRGEQTFDLAAATVHRRQREPAEERPGCSRAILLQGVVSDGFEQKGRSPLLPRDERSRLSRCIVALLQCIACNAVQCRPAGELQRRNDCRWSPAAGSPPPRHEQRRVDRFSLQSRLRSSSLRTLPMLELIIPLDQARGFALGMPGGQWLIINSSHLNSVDGQANTMRMAPQTFKVVSALQAAGVRNPVVR